MLAPEVTAQAEKRIGQTIGGKWHLDRVIGVGGMAAVYEATHRNRNRVAIKLLHPILSLDEGTRHRFLREGYVANTIRHDGAVQVLDDDMTEEGVAFLVMELLQGETVEHRMDRKGGVLEIHEAMEIVEQLLDVLCVAHDQGVVHRDIKPDNLFLTDDGRLKVLDFGIARLHQGDTQATRAGSFMGTPAYCAPEQARGRWDEVDARTDLFSVGATLFACLTGTHVHPAETSSEQLALAIGATARSLGDALPQAPAELVQFVDRALRYDKADRFQSARAMKAAAQKIRAGLKEVQGSPTFRLSAEAGRLAAGMYDSGTLGAEADSFEPPSTYLIKPPVRILVGILAAGVLATFLLIVAQNDKRDLEQRPSASSATMEARPQPTAPVSAATDARSRAPTFATTSEPAHLGLDHTQEVAETPTKNSDKLVPRTTSPKAHPNQSQDTSSLVDKSSPPSASFPGPSEPARSSPQTSPPSPPMPPSEEALFRSRF